VLLTTPVGFFPIANGATSAPFQVNTLAVAVPTFTGIRSNLVTPLHRLALTWLAVVPGAGPAAPPPLLAISGVSVSPAEVVGGAASVFGTNGTVTLNGVPPSRGVTVMLASDNPAATLPASVFVPAASTSATFPVTTVPVNATTTVAITATPVPIAGTFGGAAQSTKLIVDPAPANATLTVTATGRSGESITSSPVGIGVAVGSTGTAAFAVNSSVSLSDAGGRDVIWSGACSSGGAKQKTCTLVITANAAVSAAVQ